MEGSEKEGIGTTKTNVGKPPTRLQKHAPALLKLNQMGGTIPFGPSTGSSPAAIPLLSPLILSPNTKFMETEEFIFPTWKNGDQECCGGGGDKQAAAIPTPLPTAVGWKHPAVPGYVEASTLYTLFQTQCLVVSDAQ